MKKKRSFRFTCEAHEVDVVANLLHLQGFIWEDDGFTPLACRLLEEPFPLGSSLAAFFGLIYIQDRASMLPPLALNPPKGGIVLDMCSSPGSKTGQLGLMVGREGFVLGNEVSSSRLATLRNNLQQMNIMQAATCCHDGQKIPLPDASFDYIQLDPPCSGWGTVDKNPKVMEMWKAEKTLPLVHLQRELLKEASRLLRPNGVLVYSTCTTNVEENEAQVRFAIEELGLILMPLAPLPEFVMDDALLSLDGVWRVSPRVGDTQGFFVARLCKKNNENITHSHTDLHEENTWGNTLTAKRLQELGLSDDDIEGGYVAAFGEHIHYISYHASFLPKQFKWQGMSIGKVSKSAEIQMLPRMRMGSHLPYMDFDGMSGINAIRGLLSGQSLTCSFQTKEVMMRWNNLILGRLKVKNKRLLWTER